MPTKIAPFLTTKFYPPGERVYASMDPATQFGQISNAAGEPERVHAVGRVIVPVHDWSAWKIEEDVLMAKVMVIASQANPLKVASVANLDQPFWSAQRGVRAFLINPSLKGKFRMPLGLTVIESEEVPVKSLILIGPPALAGYYIKQGARRNILCHNKRGLTCIQLHVNPVSPA